MFFLGGLFRLGVKRSGGGKEKAGGAVFNASLLGFSVGWGALARITNL